MKHINKPKQVKWIAMLLAIIFAVASLASFSITYLTYFMGLYENPLDKVLSEKYNSVKNCYAAKIFNDYVGGIEPPEIPNMEYGILISDPEKPNITEQKDYVYSNFSKTKPLDTSYQRKFFLGNDFYNNHNYYTPSNTLLQLLTIGDDDDFMHWENELVDEFCVPINQIVYNQDDGLFYYVTKEYSLPITEFAISYKYAEAKSFIQKNVLSDYEYYSLNDYIVDSTNSLSDIDEYQKTAQNNTYFYESQSGRCKPLNTSAYKEWGDIYIDSDYGPYTFPTDNITAVTTSELNNIVYDKSTYLMDEPYYESAEILEEAQNTGYPFITYQVKIDSDEAYWVIANVKENIDTSSNDFFAKTHNFLTMLYNFRYVCILLTILFGIGCIIALRFICLATKCQKETQGLSISIWHKIPLLFYLCGMGFLTMTSFYLLCRQHSLVFKGKIGGKLGLTIELVYLIATVTFIILLFANLVTRYYGKVLWKNTVTIYVVTFFKKGWKSFLEHTGLFIKGGLIYLLICLAQLICLLCTDSYWGAEWSICIWIIFIVITAPIYYYLLKQLIKLQNGSKRLAEGNFQEKINTKRMLWEFKKHGEFLNQLNEGMKIALQEQLKSERFKTELITNVSHDIKTPLTSIINYVDLLQKENITEKERTEYLEVLERQSARLKKLIEDLIEASKASTGNLTVNFEECDIDILLTQTIGEFEEKLQTNNLELIIKKEQQPIYIQADNRHLWRIFDNLMNNICKYAQPGTRVYINQEFTQENIKIIFLNTSKYALNISGEELMERFVRGDASRNTEGNGLGLSIARSLAELMCGTLEIIVEGDLFKIVLTFPKETN